MDLLGNLRFTFSDRLKTFREAKGWTQHDLAAATEMSVSTIRGYEQQTRWPDPEDIENFAKCLECEVQDLLGRPKVKEVTPEEALEIIARAIKKPPLVPVPAVDLLDGFDEKEKRMILSFVEETRQKKLLNRRDSGKGSV